MNQTMEQLLRDMGFGGSGGGIGGSGAGYGAQRGGGNVGLYGMLPGMASLGDARGGGSGGGNMYGKGGAGTAADFETEGYEATVEGNVGGTAEGNVPLRYRQAVGRYFRRILDETESQH